MINGIMKKAAELRQAGELEAAAEQLSEAAISDPTNVIIWRGLGEVLLELERPSEAILCFERVLAGKPNDASALNDLGFAHLANQSFEFGLPFLQQAVELEAGNVIFLGNLANCYRALEQFEDERIILAKANKASRGSQEVLLRQADNLAILGQIEAARELYERLARDPSHKVAGLRGLCYLEKQSDGSALLARIEATLAEESRPEARRSLQHCASKCLIESGQATAGFDRVIAAKAEWPADFDRNRFELTIAAAMLSDSQLPLGLSSSEERPIFIVGMPRCGSTLLEKFLAGHSRIHGAGERLHMPRISRMLGLYNDKPDDFLQTVLGLPPEAWPEIAEGYMGLVRLRNGRNDVLYVDKLLHNFLNIGLILRFFPKARIIHAMRHPLDACVAIYTAPLKSQHHPYAERLDDLGWYYKLYLELMSHWTSRYPEAILSVRYEDVVSAPDMQMRRVCQFLGLPFEEAMLDHRANGHVAQTISKWQVHQPLYKSSVSRWKPHKEKLGPILAHLEGQAEAYSQSS
ncbi:sulfotransferase [Xinfangfangia sp. CPCC 101601]|uniref:Sulfotransferase n=1 Tax=Pseudogemmobacter lacusdianii TaxID=3069608 RepID=A0ABU0W0Q8_9RHOB|nr:sulfotransferase [Xinfangfangia sp. CPCC 101601]MDQ2067544.1 sulfotransferase [Xinfangfangia sp. CPCC 101601]